MCPNLRGRIREGEKSGDTNLKEERKRSRSPRSSNRENITKQEEEREQEEERKDKEDSEPEIVIPESERIPNTPSVEDYIKHQVTHYPFKAWCPICVKNAAQNNPHKKIKHARQTEVFGMA